MTDTWAQIAIVAVPTAVLGAVGYTVNRFVKGVDGLTEKHNELKEGQSEIRQTLGEIKVVLVGINGDNGINADVKHLQTGQRELWKELDRRHSSGDTR